MNKEDVKLIVTYIACVILLAAAILAVAFPTVKYLCTDYGPQVITINGRKIYVVEVCNISHEHITYKAADGSTGSVSGTFTVEKGVE